MVWRLSGILIVLLLSACAGNNSGGSASRLPETTAPETASKQSTEIASATTVELAGVLDNSPEVNAEKFMVRQLEAMANPTTELDSSELDMIAESGLSKEVVSNIAALAESESFFEDLDGPQLLISRVNLPLIPGDSSTFTGYQEGQLATVEMCWDDNSRRLSLDGEVLEDFDRTLGVLFTLVMENASWKVAAIDYENVEVLDNCV